MPTSYKKSITRVILSYFLKSYSKVKKIWKPTSAIIHLCKIISTFYNNYLEKPRAIFLPINSALPITKLSDKLFVKT